MDKKYSGKQIIKAGERLLDPSFSEDKPAFEKTMDILSYWRFKHEVPLEKAENLLKKISPKKDKSAIFAKRLKRSVSIVTKLKRFRDMKLKNMQDIGGCRAIVSNPKKVEQIVRDLKKEPQFKNSAGKVKFKDYINEPKEDGYRGYHLIGKFSDGYGENRSIEFQIRTKLQHDWATALEIVDLFTGQALKSNQGEADWSTFFSAVSEQFALMESVHLFDALKEQEQFDAYVKKLSKNESMVKSCNLTKKLEKKLNVFHKLDAFANSLKIVDGHLQETFVDGYVLLEVNTAKATVSSTVFKKEDSKAAEEMYIKLEKKCSGKFESVVALVSTTALGGIKKAYPNYFADSTDFLIHLNMISASPPIKKQGWFERAMGF